MQDRRMQFRAGWGKGAAQGKSAFQVAGPRISRTPCHQVDHDVKDSARGVSGGLGLFHV